jgi:hypothetical protein
MWRGYTGEWQSTPLDIYKRQETSADLLPFKKSTCGHKKNPRFDSIFYNNAPVLKSTFACPRLKNDFPSFLSSLYVRTTNITLAEKVYFPLLFLFKTPA